MKQLLILFSLLLSITYVGCRKKCPELPPANKSNVKMEMAVHQGVYDIVNADTAKSVIMLNEPFITDSVMNHGIVLLYMQKAKDFAGTMDLTRWYTLPSSIVQEYEPILPLPPQTVHYSFSYTKSSVKIIITPKLKSGGMLYNFKIVTYRNI